MSAPAYEVNTSPGSDDKKATPEQKALFEKCRKCVSSSRAAMGKYYSMWDRQWAIYSSRKRLDKDDEKAERDEKPTKQTVPLTYAQVQTFVSFCFLLYTQNDDFFAYKPRGAEGFKLDEDGTTILARDLRKNQWPVMLYSFLVNTAVFSLGIVKHSWVEEYARMKVPTTQPGVTAPGGYQITDDKKVDQVQKILRYEGNRLMGVSPYRFFPDTSLPLTRFQEGEFCASEDEYSRVQLKQMEADGDLIEGSVDAIPEMTAESFQKRGPSRVNSFRPMEEGKSANVTGQSRSSVVLVTEVQIKVVPAKMKDSDGKPLGKETYPVMYVVWIANDQKIIKCEPMGYLHGQFTYDVAQFSPGEHELVGQGLAEMADWLQNVITWFINSHITSVKDSIGGKFVVDPSGVDMRSLNERSPYIMLKKGAMKTGVDRWLKQLQTTDTTAAHMSDAQVLMSVLETVTGINGNMQGQYNGGRRSAQESRTVTQGAAGRSKMTATVIWNQALDPLGQKMLTNARQGLSFQTFIQIIAGPGFMQKAQQDPTIAQDISIRFQMFQGQVEDLIANNDFFEMDGTLQSEKGFIAQSLQELLQAVSSPEMALTLGIDPNQVLEAIQALRGITNLGSFAPTPERLQMLQQMVQQQNAPPPPKPPTDSMQINYADAPPDIQRQMEALFGMQPSQGMSTTQQSQQQLDAATQQQNAQLQQQQIDNQPAGGTQS